MIKRLTLKNIRKRKYSWKYFKRCRFIYRPDVYKKRKRLRAEWAVSDGVRFLVSPQGATILNDQWAANLLGDSWVFCAKHKKITEKENTCSYCLADEINHE